jgi:rRNA maturation RNase YbeY
MSELTLRNRQRIRRLDLRLFRGIAEAFLSERLGTRPYEISISIVAAPEMAALNEKYLHHSGSTDVITFGYSDRKSSEALLGDIFICIDDAVKQAREFRTSWQSEMVRYLVHGVLHLQGYDDLSPAKRRVMKREENRFLKELEARFRPASALEPVLKLRGVLRRGILAAAKAARVLPHGHQQPRSGLGRPQTKDPPPGGFSRKKLPGFVAPQSKIHQGASPSSRLHPP